MAAHSAAMAIGAAALGALLDRMLDNMSPGEEETALAWFDALPSPQSKAVLRALASR